MTPRFRMVHFLADPFTGARFPIAALVDVEGRVKVAKVPDPISLPGLARHASTRAAVRFALDSLSSASDFDSLPPSTGPYVALGEPRTVPVSSKDAIDWVLHSLLRRGERPTRTDLFRAGREAAGYRFLEQWQVAKWVGRGFRPEEHFKEFSLVLPQVAQYVRGKSELLLMEPISAKSESVLFRSLRHIGTTFMAWQHGFEQYENRPKVVDYIAYVVGVEEKDMIAEARHVLAKSGASVVDVSATAERTRFLETIRRTAVAA